MKAVNKPIMKIKTGTIIKGIGGFYYVKCDDEIVECRARGNFRKKSILPYVGDVVSVNIEESLGYVVEIHKRKNFFVRPPIANIDVLLIVSSVSDPAPDTVFIDKMIITALANNVLPVLCFNKADLKNDSDKIVESYKQSGFKVFVTSTVQKTGTEEVKNYITSSGVTAVCGFSGVGKSSLLNTIMNNQAFETGAISEKLNRGKHTTRHVELIELCDGAYIADTPGFSSVSLSESLDCDELINFYPDFSDYTDGCKYRDCNHTTDKFCGVCDAVNDEKIPRFRYENYKMLYNTLKNSKEW